LVASGLHGVPHGPLRVDRRARQRPRRELPAAGPMRLATSVAALHECVHGDRPQNRNQNKSSDRESEQAPMAAGGGGPLGPELAFRLVLGPPREDGLGEDVVEDLVSRALRPVLGGAPDTLLDTALTHAMG